MGISIFISHSSSDIALVNTFIDDILKAGIGIPTENIKCTSTPGHKICLGANIDHQIKSFIANSSLSVFMLSENFYASHYCLCEMGAVWATSKRSVFFLIPPLQRSSINDVFERHKTERIDDKEALFQFANEIKDDFNVNINIPNYDRKCDDFISNFKKIPPSTSKRVSYTSYVTLQSTLEEYKKDNKIKFQEITRLNTVIAKIKESKTADEIYVIELNSLPEKDKFESLLQETATALANIKCSRIVRESIYYHCKNEEYLMTNVTAYFCDTEIQRSFDYKQIKYNSDETGIEPETQDKQVSVALKKIQNLTNFMASASEKFIECYEKNYDSKFDIESRLFWEKHLGL